MENITSKIKTHRFSIAQAIVTVGKTETIEAILNKSLGDVVESSRIAGLFAIKRTSEVYPHSHPIPIEFASITHRIEALDIVIESEVHSVYRTGTQTEAMHGATVAALTIYDMVKGIDRDVKLSEVRLLKTRGDQSQYHDTLTEPIRASVIVCSDSISMGTKEDFAGKGIVEKLKKLQIDVEDYGVIPDEMEVIRENVLSRCDKGFDLVIITGGTGLSPRDVTPEAVRPLLDREIPGIAEAARGYGQEQMPYAMLSRSFAGMRGDTLILALPGSTRGAMESMDALFPYLLHIFRVAEGMRHE